MPIGIDGRVIEERRTSTPIGNTGSVPEGTMVTVPAAPPSGGTGIAPVVAVNTTSKWKDPVFLLSAISGLTGLVTAVIDVLPASGPIDWRITGPKVVFAVLGALSSFLRVQINSVTR